MKFFVGIRNKGGPSPAQQQQQQDVVDTISLEDSSLYTSGLHTLTTNRSHTATSIIITTDEEEGTTISQKIRRHRYVSTDDTFGEASTLSDHFSSSYDGIGYLSSSSFMVGGGGRLPAITTTTTTSNTNNASAAITKDPKQQETPVKRIIPHFEGGPFSQGKTTTPEKAKSNPSEKHQQHQSTPTTMSRSSCHTYQTTPSHTTTKASPESATMTSVSSTSPSVPSFENDTKTTTNTTTPGVDDDSKSYSDHDSLDSSLRGYLGVGMTKEGRLHSTNMVDSPTKRILHTGQVPVMKDHSEEDNISNDDNDSDWTPQIRNRQSNTLLISSPLLQDSQQNDDNDDIDSHRDPHSSWEDDDDDDMDKLYKWDNDDDDDNKDEMDTKKKKEIDSLYDDDESTLAMTIASKVNMSDAELMDERNASPGALRLTEDGLKEHNNKYHHCNPWDNISQEEEVDGNALSHVPSHHRTLPGFAVWKQQQQQQLNNNKVVPSKPLDNKEKNKELSKSVEIQHDNKDDELEKRWKHQMPPVTSTKHGTNPSTHHRHHTNLSRPLWILPLVPEEDTPTNHNKEDDSIPTSNDTTRIIKTTGRAKHQFSTSTAKQHVSASVVVTPSSRQQHRKPFSWIRRKSNNNNPRNPVVVTKNSAMARKDTYELSKVNEETCEEEEEDEAVEFQRIEQRRQAYLKHHRILEAQAKQKRLTSECNNHRDCNDKDNDNTSTNDNSIDSQPNHNLLTFPHGSKTVLPIPILQIRSIVPTKEEYVQNKNDVRKQLTVKHTTRINTSPILPSFQKGHTNLNPSHDASRQFSSNPSIKEVDDVNISDHHNEDKEDITPISQSRIPISADLSNVMILPMLDSRLTTTTVSQSNAQQPFSKPVSTLSLDLIKEEEEEENTSFRGENKDDLDSKDSIDSIPYKIPAKLEVIQEELSTPSPSALASLTTNSVTLPCDMAVTTTSETKVSSPILQTESFDNSMSSTTPVVSNITSSATHTPPSSSSGVINSTSKEVPTKLKTMSAKEQRATTLTLETERHTENSIERCLACGVYEPTHVALPCLHYGVCDDCATVEPRICPVCGPTTATKKQIRFSKVFF